MRILHLPVAFGRQAWGLSRAERRLGHTSDVVAFEQNIYRLPADRILFDERDGVLKQELKRWKFFLESIFAYDVFHFHFGQKFFVLNPRPFKEGDSLTQAVFRFVYWLYSLGAGKLDLWILRLLGKRIILTYHGDDIRQGDRSRELYRFNVATEVGQDYYDAYSDERKRKSALVWSRYAKQIFVVSPDLVAMAPAGAQVSRYIGVDPSDWVECPANTNPRLLFVHAPTHRLGKGTRFIEAAVERLRARGFEFDFQLIEGLSNDEARRLYARADVIIDQVLAGWFGVVAVELMAMGKAVVCYLRPESLAEMPAEFLKELPIINADPETLESKLEWCITHSNEVRSLGRASRSFALKWFNPDEIAREIVASYE